jgi:hypothetical protein
MAKAGGPIRNGQPCVVAGNQPTGHDQQKGQRGNKYGETMMSGVVRRRGQNSSRKLSILSLQLLDRAIWPSDHRAVGKPQFFNLIPLSEILQPIYAGNPVVWP